MILCSLYRRKLSTRVDADLDLEPALQRHVQECSGCRHFYEQELCVVRGLVRSAGKERVAPSPFLQGRIIAAVERSASPAHGQSAWRRLVWAAGLAVALLLVIRAVRGPLAPHLVLPTPDMSQVEKRWAALERSLPDEKKLQQWSGTVEQPLDQEMRALFHDARFAAQTLVHNFLPDSMARLPGEDAPR